MYITCIRVYLSEYRKVIVYHVIYANLSPLASSHRRPLVRDQKCIGADVVVLAPFFINSKTLSDPKEQQSQSCSLVSATSAQRSSLSAFGTHLIGMGEDLFGGAYTAAAVQNKLARSA